MARRYKLTIFKWVAGMKPYGAKSYEGPLDHLIDKIAIPRLGGDTPCRRHGNRYVIGDGVAELERLR